MSSCSLRQCGLTERISTVSSAIDIPCSAPPSLLRVAANLTSILKSRKHLTKVTRKSGLIPRLSEVSKSLLRQFNRREEPPPAHDRDNAPGFLLHTACDWQLSRPERTTCFRVSRCLGKSLAPKNSDDIDPLEGVLNALRKDSSILANAKSVNDYIDR